MFKSKEKKAAEAKAKAAAAEKARAAQAKPQPASARAAVIKEIESAAWDHVIVRRERARGPLKAGLKVYQYMDAVSSIKGDVIPMIGTMATDERGGHAGRMGKVAAGRRSTAPCRTSRPQVGGWLTRGTSISKPTPTPETSSWPPGSRRRSPGASWPSTLPRHGL